jgi:hypothetical protein
MNGIIPHQKAGAVFLRVNEDDKVSEKEEIIQLNNYYAFGLNMEGNWNGANGANQYQYKGKSMSPMFLCVRMFAKTATPNTIQVVFGEN